jgi:ribosomal protein S4
MEVDPETFTTKIVTDPSREQIEAQVDTQLIVEHYSR